MMRGLTRYILKQLIIGMLIITIGLSILLWLSQSLRFVDLIVNKGVSISVFLKLTSLLLPGFLMVILPIAIFAVTLFVYNKMISDRELIVMRAAGMSQWQISSPAIILASIICILSYALTLWIAPSSVRSFREFQWEIRQDVSHLVLKEGEFTDISEGIVVFVAKRSEDNVLSGILITDTRNPNKDVTVMAERGALITGGSVPRLHLINGNRQVYTPKNHNFSILHFDSYTAEFGKAQRAKETRFRDARERGLKELLADYPPEQLHARDVRRFRVEACQRLLIPLQVLGMTVLALYGLLGSAFNRRGQGMRIITTIAFMVIAEAAILGANNLAGRSENFLGLLPIITLLLIAIPAYLLYAPRHQRKATTPKGANS